MVRLAGRTVMRVTEPPAYPEACPQGPLPWISEVCKKGGNAMQVWGYHALSKGCGQRDGKRGNRFKKKNTGTMPGTKGPARDGKNPE